MFLNKMNRLADVGSRARTRFLRRYVSGPLRETKDVDPEEVNVLAQQFGCSPQEWMYLREQDRMMDKLVDKIVDDAPDTSMDFKVNYVMDEFVKVFGHPPGFRKLVYLGDSLDQEASGCRIFNATEALLAKHGKTVEGLTFAIQGFGHVGSWIARLVHEAGGKVVAVSDLTGALKDKEGIDITALLKHMLDSKGNCLANFSGGDSMEEVELLTSECDVLIPGALGRFLNRKTAAAVKAKFVIDAADYTNHIDSDEVLSKKGVVILPDIFERLYGVNPGYLEWLKTQGFTWGKDERELDHMKNPFLWLR